MIEALVKLVENFLSLSFSDFLLVASIVALTSMTKKLGMWPYSLVAFPGTAAHELAHYSAALLLFAKPDLPSLIPTRIGRSWYLGQVRFQPRLYNRIPVALAPLLLIPLGMWYSVEIMRESTGWWYLFHAWIVATMFLAAAPSRSDWMIAMPALVVFGLAWWILMLLY